jgi:hypothetical protein
MREEMTIWTRVEGRFHRPARSLVANLREKLCAAKTYLIA